MHENAICPVQAALEDLLALVDVVEDGVRVFLDPCREDNDLVNCGQTLKHVKHVGAQPYTNLDPVEIVVERGLKFIRQFVSLLCRNQRLVHVEDQKLVVGLLSELNRLFHDVVLILVGLAHIPQLVAVLEQLDQLNVNQFCRVLLLLLQRAGTLLLRSLKTVCRPVRGTAIVEPLVNSLLLLGVWLLVDLEFLKARIHNMANVVQRLRL